MYNSKAIKVFRYLSSDSLIATISDFTLKFSLPTTFNDPYDNNIPVASNFKEKNIKNSIKSSFERYISERESFEQKCLFDRMFCDFIKSDTDILSAITSGNMDYVVDEVFSNMLDNNTDFLFNFPKPSSKDVICCFSKRNDNLLMWGHYADNHKGGIVEFELPQKFADDSFEIVYTDTVPKVDAYNLYFGDTSTVLKLLRSNCRIKSSCWSYEEEIRFVFFISDNYNNPRISNRNILRIRNDKYALIPFSPKLIRGIYLGAKFRDADYEKFMSYFRGGELTAPVYKASLKKDTFGLDFVKVQVD